MKFSLAFRAFPCRLFSATASKAENSLGSLTGLRQRIDDDFKEAMKQKDAQKLSVLKTLRTSITVGDKKKGVRMNDSQVFASVIVDCIHAAKNNVENFQQSIMEGGLPEEDRQKLQSLLEKERNEMTFIRDRYAPELWDAEKTQSEMLKIIEKLQADGVVPTPATRKEIGRIMKASEKFISLKNAPLRMVHQALTSILK